MKMVQFGSIFLNFFVIWFWWFCVKFLFVNFFVQLMFACGSIIPLLHIRLGLDASRIWIRHAWASVCRIADSCRLSWFDKFISRYLYLQIWCVSNFSKKTKLFQTNQYVFETSTWNVKPDDACSVWNLLVRITKIICNLSMFQIRALNLVCNLISTWIVSS